MSIPSFLTISRVDDGPALAGALFKRRFDQQLVRFGDHYVALYRAGEGRFATLGYLHVTAASEIALIGGGCTDNQMLGSMDHAHSAALRASGGVLLHMLLYILETRTNDFEAFFGVCGNPRAYEVLLRIGFKPTPDPKLLIFTNRALGASRTELLIEKAASFMPF